jgi:signal peptidase I
LTAAAALALRSALLIVTVNGRSMAPTYDEGDRVLIRRSRRCRRGSVVVFRSSAIGREVTPGREVRPDGGDEGARRLVMKRVAAVPGDPVPADVLVAAQASAGDRVPPGRLVVRGDGARSTDSRHWGYLPADAVVGHVVADLAGPRTGPGRPHSSPRSVAR